MTDLERVAVRVSDGLRSTLTRINSLALGIATITAIIDSFRLIFGTSELRLGSARVSEVVHRRLFLWIAGS